ncbi:MAG: hypothetical protein HY203_03490 [Nitrospirae bacterium]|nr:hypothetical protein [Nitrospirota bacterium]
MPDKMTQSTKSRRSLLDRYVTDISLFIKKQCPEAVIEVSLARYEGEDAHILVFPPDSLSDKAREKLADACADKSVSILLETGLLILIGVYEPAQRR